MRVCFVAVEIARELVLVVVAYVQMHVFRVHNYDVKSSDARCLRRYHVNK